MAELAVSWVDSYGNTVCVAVEVCVNCGQGIRQVGNVWCHATNGGSIMNCRNELGFNLTPVRIANPVVWR